MKKQIYKKDFKPIVKWLRRIRKESKASKRESLHKKHKGEYPLDFQIADSESEGRIFVCNAVLGWLKANFKIT